MKNDLFKSVRDRSYFDKAIEWYYYKYMFCIVERSWMMLMMVFLLVCLFLLLLNIYLLFPIKKDLNFIKYVDHGEDEFSMIHKLHLNKDDDEYTSISKYLISKYVEIYESSRAFELEFRRSFIQKNSIYKVYQDFQEKINKEISNLSNTNISNIKIMKLSVDQSVKKLITFSGRAVVIFKVDRNNKEIENNRTVDISFTLSNIQAALSNIIPFKFIIDSYEYR
ncbi:MAG: conjugal transfer protein TraJ [Wolbachia endosymbiont of Menacanthus eurysternus]|nr:MAG: conjugal transfer protein TraJ [Wolbachia endosymbiont of Menacanthus eurysternus]